MSWPKTIPLHLTAVALATLAAVVVGLATLPLDRTLLAAVLAALAAAITVEDWRHFRVPDLMNAVLALTGMIAFVVGVDPLGQDAARSLLTVVIDATLTGGALLLVREGYFRLRGIEGLGLGDVKLAAAAGVWVGWQQFALVVLLATLAALFFVLAKTIRNGGWTANAHIPYASFLAPAIWFGWYIAQWSSLSFS